jgi:hypothetical protein
MSGLIDYAGLFPPAALDMQPTVENFARDRRGEYEWMLGRLICPATRLKELSEHAAALMPGTFATSGYRENAYTQEPWRISVIANAELGECLDAMQAFNEHHATELNGLAVADALEIKTPDTDTIEDVIERVPDEVFPFCEVPVDEDCRGLIAAMAGSALAAKIRTGGVEASMMPTCEQVAAFVSACAAADVPFKATAGLHHPVRGDYRLTYELDSKEGTMHGFLNVFIAAALARGARLAMDELVPILEERDATAFTFSSEGVGWRDKSVDLIVLAKVRETFALSYGSCSFGEPVDDLKSLGLL